MKIRGKRYRFTTLFVALIILIVTYPSFQDTPTGAALGALMSVLVLGAGVFAIYAHRRVLIAGGILAALAGGASVYSLVEHTRGTLLSEYTFTAYYAFLTVAVFVEVLRTRTFHGDSMFGIVSVYLLIGITFGSGYDLLETLQPGSFVINVEGIVHDEVGFRQLLYFSFATLTSVGYGDISPVTDRAQSLAILEGVAGILYIAVLVGGFMSNYRPEE